MDQVVEQLEKINAKLDTIIGVIAKPENRILAGACSKS
jgi:hypothetical protein